MASGPPSECHHDPSSAAHQVSSATIARLLHVVIYLLGPGRPSPGGRDTGNDVVVSGLAQTEALGKHEVWLTVRGMSCGSCGHVWRAG